MPYPQEVIYVNPVAGRVVGKTKSGDFALRLVLFGCRVTQSCPQTAFSPRPEGDLLGLQSAEDLSFRCSRVLLPC